MQGDKVADAGQGTLDIGALYQRYSGVLYHKCLRLLGDAQEADDAVQETFILAYRARASFHYGDSALPWLYRIATNVCLKVIRTRRRKGAVLTANIDRGLFERASLLDQLEARSLVAGLVDELDEMSLQVLVAHLVEGMDQQRTAGVLGVSRRTVVGRLQRIRRALRRLRKRDQ